MVNKKTGTPFESKNDSLFYSESLMRQLIALLTLLVFPALYAQTVHIVAVGDILLHTPLQKWGQEKGFSSLWAPLIPELQQADLSYGNLEGPVAEMLDMRGNQTDSKAKAYTAFPMFNYPPTLIAALKISGFDLVSTANNHTLDRWGAGIDKTISALQDHKLSFTGTRRQNSEDAWFTETQAKTLSIAWLACTQDTNGINDKHRQVLNCYRDKVQVLELISELAKTHDAVIVTPHWGVEYQSQPNKAQQKLAQEFAEAGALAIQGSHPHCVQPFAWLKTKTGKKVFVAYSLGNFISNQGSLKNRSSGLLSLYLNKQEGTTAIAKVSYQPTYMENRGNKIGLTKVSSKKHPAYQLLKTVLEEDYLSLSSQ